jgi:CubicO group peptidase (beta-lactamase class C family)/ketosteroid isomerase-like protein
MKMKQQHLITSLLALLLLVATPVVSGHAPSDHQAQIDFGKLEEVILAELKETNTPGAAFGIVKGDRLIFAKGFGVSNIETGAPVTPETLFRIASVTKMFTASALVTLFEKGKLKLDEPIGKYAKGLDARIAQLTANQLLSHTSGLRDRGSISGLSDDSVLGETVKAIQADWLFTEPGRIYSYSNPGYQIAGYVIEEVGRKPYADQMEESLFKPLGMETTTLRPTMAMTWPLSQGHDYMGGRPKVIRPTFENAGVRPAGAIFSSVDDLSRFAIAFMNGGQIQGRQALLPDVIRQLSTPQAGIPGSEDQYGYGLRIGLLRGIRVFSHPGNMDGFGSDIIMAPDHRVAVIILANKSRGHLPMSLEKAMELMLPLAAKANEDSKTLPLSASEAERYVGRYGFTETIVEVLFNDGKLLHKQGGLSAPMSKISETRFTVAPVGSSPKFEIYFVMGADGNAEFLHGRLRSLKKLPSSADQGSAKNERAEATTDLALTEVQSAAEAFIKAFNNHDWEPFRNSFADDATMFFPSATMAAARANGRTEIEAIFKTLFDAARKRKDSPPYLNIEPKDTRIRMSGNAAVVTFHLGGKDSLGRRTIIFEKQKGRWLIIHLHASTMAISNETR